MNTNAHFHQFMNVHLVKFPDFYDYIAALSHAPADYPAAMLEAQRAGYISHMKSLHCGYIEDDALIAALNESVADDAPEGNAELFVDGFSLPGYDY